VAGDPYRIRFTVPEGWKVKSKGAVVKNGVGCLAIQSDRSAEIDWMVEFVKMRC
jgi:hypothetical protein